MLHSAKRVCLLSLLTLTLSTSYAQSLDLKSDQLAALLCEEKDSDIIDNHIFETYLDSLGFQIDSIASKHNETVYFKEVYTDDPNNTISVRIIIGFNIDPLGIINRFIKIVGNNKYVKPFITGLRLFGLIETQENKDGVKMNGKGLYAEFGSKEYSIGYVKKSN